ncbi:MAG TPA: glutathione S-transferase C-terminal domain-containing protein [Polyangiaceae bacterium]|nr:glutathione S-transferase C-terminal domain-containing protein [Polyangiaceae bacterium]
MTSLKFVDVETARAARGPRLVVAGSLPSPWSEAAKGIFHMKALPIQVVGYPRIDDAFRTWTGAMNVPVLLTDDEPPRTGWAEILAFAERWGGKVSLIPAEPAARVRHHGLAHELCGEGGLGWCSRLIMTDGGLTSGGERSFPLPVAQYLAGKYGYAPARLPAARARLLEIFALFDVELAKSRAAGRRYLLGAEPTALDIYLATFLTCMLPLAEADCPQFLPRVRPAFAYLVEQVGADIPPALIAHRQHMFSAHLPLPIVLRAEAASPA